MLRVVMAVSADGFVARGPDDRMKWTGPTDKRVFRDLTCTRGAVMGAGTATYELMRGLRLPGRELVRITRQADLFDDRGLSMTLGAFSRVHPDGWLIGGQTVVLAAMGMGLVDRVYLVRNPASLGSGQPDYITGYMYSNRWSFVDCIGQGEGVVMEEWHGA